MREGWEIKLLKEATSFKSGKTVSKDIERNFGEVIYTKVGDMNLIGNDVNITTSSRFVNFKDINENQIIPIGAIIFPKRGGAIATNKKRKIIKPTIVDLNTMTIAPSEMIISDYLYYWFELIDLNDLSNGTSIPQINNNSFDNVYISFPKSLPVQKQIVAILDKAFAAIDKAKANAQQNLKNAKELFESYLQEVFEKKGEGWEEKTLVEITNKIGSGATPKGGSASYKTNGISLVRSMNVHDLNFRKKKLAFIDENQAQALANVTLQENDVLLNITGASIARCCIIPNKYLPARVNQHVSIIRPKSEIIDTNLLCLLLCSKYYKDKILITGEQGATRQAITKAQLQSFLISFPTSLLNQQKLVQHISVLSTQTKKLETIYQQKINDLEELKKSVLERAFKGELTVDKEVEV